MRLPRVERNILGAYGPWVAQFQSETSGCLAAELSAQKDFAAWRRKAQNRVWAFLAAPELPKVKVKVVTRGQYEGVCWESLSWQLPWGPRTEAVFLKPASAKPGKRLKAILALHDHGGKKYFGWRKIASIGPDLHPLLAEHRADDYDGLAWANEAAKRGYAVLVHDTFLFGSRRIRYADVLPQLVRDKTDVKSDESAAAIDAYNLWAGAQESCIAKSLFCAGTTWPGMFLREDQAALSVLCSRPDVDPKRVGCGGLSGGGLRTVFLAGLDKRIRSCFCAGFFTTWRDLLLNKSFTHTWMTYLPHLPRELDFCEILGLRAPKPTLVLQCDKDPLYTLSEARQAARKVAKIYRHAGAPRAFRFSLHSGGHQLNRDMQEEAFAWLDRELSL